MTIRFTCTECEKQFSVKDSLAGKKGKCKCGAVIRVPLKSDPTSHKTAAQKRPAKEAGTVTKPEPQKKTVPVPEQFESPPIQAYCAKCDKQSTKGSKFCQWCGISLLQQTI